MSDVEDIFIRSPGSLELVARRVAEVLDAAPPVITGRDEFGIDARHLNIWVGAYHNQRPYDYVIRLAERGMGGSAGQKAAAKRLYRLLVEGTAWGLGLFLSDDDDLSATRRPVPTGV